MRQPPRLVINGFMGAGKTTVARVLAARLDCQMIDLDDFIAGREGRTPQQIIDEDGELRFRELETQALRDALEQTPARVIALGGGAWTLERNRALIERHGCLTVWLDAPFELCWQRIEKTNNSRPLARDCESARRRYDKRRNFYRLSSLRVEAVEGKNAEDLATEIAELTNAESS